MENLDHSNNKNVSLSLIAEYGASDSDSDDTETRSNDHTGNEDSDAASINEMVIKNNIINACAHGPLSRTPDEVDTTRHMIIDSLDSGVVEYEVTEYRDMDSASDSSSDSSDSDVDSVKDIEEISSCDENEGKADKPGPVRVHGELGLDDLPPIEDLAISLPAQETIKIGTITSIVDRLVIVRAFPETPAVDLDSILFLDNGAKALGKVFDVFGPVTEPHYCVRFNSEEHVRSRGVLPGADVFIAPRSSHTSYVFLAELMKIKGSDASWLNDIEPPAHQIDYSDDEEERRANRARKEQRQQQKPEESDGETSKNQQRKVQEPRRNQRPAESSSRFGSGPSRARNPFAATRRNPNTYPRFGRPWGDRTPPPHPADNAPFSAPPSYPPTGPPFFPSPFNPNIPPPFMDNMGNAFRFGGNPRMGMNIPPFRHNVPIFGSNYCNIPHSPWSNGPPPAPGT